MLHSFSLHHKQPSLKHKQHLPICSLKSNIPSTLTSIHPLHKPSSSTKNRPNILSQFNYPHKPSLKSTYIPSHPKNHSFSTLNPSKNKSYNNSLHKSFKPETHLELANTTASTGNKKRISSERVCQLHNKSKKNSSKKNLHQFSFHLIPVVTNNKVNIVNYTNNALKKKNNISFKNIILSQDATMQHRMEAGLRKYVGEDINIINYRTWISVFAHVVSNVQCSFLFNQMFYVHKVRLNIFFRHVSNFNTNYTYNRGLSDSLKEN